MESVLDVESNGVQSSVERVPSVLIGGSLSADVDALGPEVERLSVVSSSPAAEGVSVGTTTTVFDDGVTVAAKPVDVAVQTEGGQSVLRTSSMM